MTDYCQYKIGLTLLGIARLPDLNIPDPFTPPFDEFSLRTVNGDGIVFGQGFPAFVWQWPSLDLVQFNALCAFITAGAASSKVYVRTRLPDFSFATFYAVMARPIITGEDAMPSPEGVPQYNEVSVKFSHCVEQ